MATQAKTANADKSNDFAQAFDPKFFDALKFNESVRAFAEDGFKQQNEVYAKMQEVAEKASKAAEETFAVAKDSQAELAAKAIANTKANIEAGVAFVEKLWGIKSVSEALDVQSTFFRSQFESLTAQAKEIQETSTAAVEKSMAPAKAFVEKAVA